MLKSTFSFLLWVSFILVVGVSVLSLTRGRNVVGPPPTFEVEKSQTEIESPSESFMCGSGFSADVLPAPQNVASKKRSSRSDLTRSKKEARARKLRHYVPFSAFVYESQSTEQGQSEKTQCDAFRIPLTRIWLAEPALNDEVQLFISSIIANELSIDDARKELRYRPKGVVSMDLCVHPSCGALANDGGTENFHVSSGFDFEVARRTARGYLLARSMEAVSLAKFKTIDGRLIDTEITNGVFTAALAIALKASQSSAVNESFTQTARN